MLDSPDGDVHDRAVRWRQLVELVARGRASVHDDLFQEAIREVRSGAASVDEQVRIATARTIAQLQLPLELISTFAADKMSVAAPILAAARLTAFEWGEVLANASGECRRFIHALRSEPTNSVPPPAPPKEPDVQHQPIPSISEVVARIERLRQSREPAFEPSSFEPLDTPAARLFRWESDENGEIAWVDGAPRGPLIGRSIAQTGEGIDDARVERAFAAKIAFHDAKLELAEGTPVEGTWMVSGTPAFDPATGRFAGYRGVAERSSLTPGVPSSRDVVPTDPDSLRELAHEIRTPLNAIIGFAEIINGQYLGPAHHPYRERAAEIVAQARLLLLAVEDLDFAAKLHSKPVGDESQVNLGALAERIAAELTELANRRGVAIETATTASDLIVSVDPTLAERLILRMGTAVIERACAGESMRMSVGESSDSCTVSFNRPKALQGLSEAELFGSATQLVTETFALRLMRGLALLAGAQVVASDGQLSLVFRKARLGGDEHGVYS